MSEQPKADEPPRQRHPAGGYEYRCPKCGKLLLTGEFRGWIRTICKSRQCANKVRHFDEK